MDQLEDTADFETAHIELDRAGRFVSQTFGCWYEMSEGRHWQICPVALAHVRLGMSPGFVIKRERCSICGRPTAGCPHLAGVLYGDRRAYRQIVEADLLEISIVSRPQDPKARIEGVAYPPDRLRAEHGTAFEPGRPLRCRVCARPCQGVLEFPDGKGPAALPWLGARYRGYAMTFDSAEVDLSSDEVADGATRQVERGTIVRET
jgi:hypothetical protein